MLSAYGVIASFIVTAYGVIASFAFSTTHIRTTRRKYRRDEASTHTAQRSGNELARSAYLLLRLLHCRVARPEIDQKRPAAQHQRFPVHPADREAENKSKRFHDLFVDGDSRGDDVALRTVDESVQNVDLGLFGTETLLESRLFFLQRLDFALFFLQILYYTGTLATYHGVRLLFMLLLLQESPVVLNVLLQLFLRFKLLLRQNFVFRTKLLLDVRIAKGRGNDLLLQQKDLRLEIHGFRVLFLKPYR